MLLGPAARHPRLRADAGAAKAPEPRVALVWGGGKDAEAAAGWRARWDREKVLLSGAVASDTVPGLNPGFHIVLLGVCRGDEGVQARRVLGAAAARARPSCSRRKPPGWRRAAGG